MGNEEIILNYLKKKGEVFQYTIWKELGLQPSVVSRTLKRLERKGVVVREPVLKKVGDGVCETVTYLVKLADGKGVTEGDEVRQMSSIKTSNPYRTKRMMDDLAKRIDRILEELPCCPAVHESLRRDAITIADRIRGERLTRDLKAALAVKLACDKNCCGFSIHVQKKPLLEARKITGIYSTVDLKQIVRAQIKLLSYAQNWDSEITKRVVEKAVEVAGAVADKISGSPTVTGAAIIYIVANSLGIKLGQETVASTLGVTDVAIRYRYKEVLKILGLPQTCTAIRGWNCRSYRFAEKRNSGECKSEGGLPC